MQCMISIVVPIYNVANYLEMCLKSIISQTYSNLDIILVDDGSTDESYQICKQYQKIDSRIRVFHQHNQGLTVARRVGVNMAKGKYVGFVDGDDWIDAEMYEKLIEYAEKSGADIVTSKGFKNVTVDKSIGIWGDTLESGAYSIKENDNFIIKHIFPNSFNNREYLNGAVWNKIFITPLIRSVLNEMSDNVNGCMDDNVCVVGCVLKANKIFISDECLYHHRERTNSYTYSKNYDVLHQINYAYADLLRIINNYERKEVLLPLLYEHVANTVVASLENFFEGNYIKVPKFLFKSKIPLNSNVIVYGYGNVGKSYLLQFEKEKKYNIVGVVDENGGDYCLKLNDIKAVSFDYIIIAIANYNMAMDIKKNLIEIEVNSNKIIWEKPQSLLEYYN